MVARVVGQRARLAGVGRRACADRRLPDVRLHRGPARVRSSRRTRPSHGQPPRGARRTPAGPPPPSVGVAPARPAVAIPAAVRSARVWLPIRADSQLAARGDRSWNVFARLGAGVSVESLTAQLDGVATELAAEYRENEGWG